MLDLGASVSTQSTNQSSAYQTNNLVINVGDGKQDSSNTSKATFENLAEQEQTKKDDMAASVALGFGGNAESGDVTSQDQENAGLSLSTKRAIEKYTPYVIGGIGLLIALKFILDFSKKKKKKSK